MLCMGDYNAILQIENRVKGSQVQDNEIKDFSDFMATTGMHELKIVGVSYTLTNGHVCSKIDKAIVNVNGCYTCLLWKSRS